MREMKSNWPSTQRASAANAGEMTRANWRRAGQLAHGQSGKTLNIASPQALTLANVRYRLDACKARTASRVRTNHNGGAAAHRRGLAERLTLPQVDLDQH